MTPLRGQVLLFGRIFTAAHEIISHEVFSPISHAVPAIAHHSNESHTPGKGGKLPDMLDRMKLPSTFIRMGAAHVLVRGNVTGLDGMRGGAIPGFATAWGPDNGWMGMTGVNSVGLSLNLN